MPPREEEETTTTTTPITTRRTVTVDYSRRDSVESMLLNHHHHHLEPCGDDGEDQYCMRASDLATLRVLDGNDVCIDCGVANPDWACVSLGIFMCLECSGQHRALGTHVSKVRSVKMDSWSTDQLALMKCGGNRQCMEFLQQQEQAQEQEQSTSSSTRTIAERFDCAAAMWYHDILKARRDGRVEPTEMPSYTPTRRVHIPKAGISGGNSNVSSENQFTPRISISSSSNVLLESFNNSIQNFFAENNHRSTRASSSASIISDDNGSEESSSLSEKADTKTSSNTTTTTKNEVMLDKAKGLLRLISTKIPVGARNVNNEECK